MIEIELPLRCPFCGGKAEIHDLGNMGYFIKCSKCEINQDKLYKQRCDAVKAWNRRVKSDEYCKGINVFTNADRIRAMTDEELAEQITKWTYGRPCGSPNCGWLDWLKKEAK